MFLYKAEAALPRRQTPTSDFTRWFYLVLCLIPCSVLLTFGILSNPSISKLPSPWKWSLKSGLSSERHALLALGWWNPAVKGDWFWKHWARGIAAACVCVQLAGCLGAGDLMNAANSASWCVAYFVVQALNCWRLRFLACGDLKKFWICILQEAERFLLHNLFFTFLPFGTVEVA